MNTKSKAEQITDQICEECYEIGEYSNFDYSKCEAIIQELLSQGSEPVGYRTTNEQGHSYTVFKDEISDGEYDIGLQRCLRLNRMVDYLFTSPVPTELSVDEVVEDLKKKRYTINTDVEFFKNTSPDEVKLKISEAKLTIVDEILERLEKE